MKQMLLMLGAGLGILAMPVTARAGEATVKTIGVTFHAVAGEAGTNTTAAARITVLVMKKGKPINDLGDNTGNGTGVITLPNGWDLTTISFPDGGCAFLPVRFVNEGAGGYTIDVLPPPSSPACQWQSGDYVYVVRINKTGKDGSSLGVVPIF